MRYEVGRFRRPMRRSTEGQLVGLVDLGDGSTLSLDFTAMSGLDSRFTFSRTTLGTYVGPDGLLYGADTSTSSQTIGSSGSKTFTLAATAGVNRRYAVGDTVIASSGANNMSGTVTSYDPATQVLVFTATSSSGSGTLATWIIGTRMARFDHDPDTLAPRGLLIEGSVTNLLMYSGDWTQSGSGFWSGRTNMNVGGTWTGFTAPDNSASAIKLIPNTTIARHSIENNSTQMNGATVYTASMFFKADGYSVASIVIAGGQTRRNFTLSGAGSLGSQFGISNTATITPYPNGWYRCSVTWTTSGSGSLGPIGVWAAIPQNATTDPINGWAGDDTNGIQCWGAQIEASSGASSYIPTGASTVQRAADVVTMPITPAAIGFDTAPRHTMLLTCSVGVSQIGGFSKAVRFATSGLANCIELDFGTSTPTFTITGATGVSSGSAPTGAFVTNNSINTSLRIGYSIGSAREEISRNGVAGSGANVGSIGPINVPTQLLLAPSFTGNKIPVIWMQQFKFFPFAMPSAQLNAVTA